MKKLSIALCLFCSGVVHAQEAADRIASANARCEAARAQKLEPIRAKKIAACRRSAHPPTAGCETFFSTYGDNSAHANGSIVRGQFYDVPACVEARRTANRLSQHQGF